MQLFDKKKIIFKAALPSLVYMTRKCENLWSVTCVRKQRKKSMLNYNQREGKLIWAKKRKFSFKRTSRHALKPNWKFVATRDVRITYHRNRIINAELLYSFPTAFDQENLLKSLTATFCFGSRMETLQTFATVSRIGNQITASSTGFIFLVKLFEKPTQGIGGLE